MLLPVVGRHLDEVSHLRWIPLLRVPERAEVLVLSGNREPAQARLEIDHERLKPVRGRDHLLRVSGFERALAQTHDRDDQDHERDREADRERPDDDRNPREQA